ncbi:ribonucleoside-triphosphate reductase [Candidatus Nomurabacteria bacterium RIFCSPLOWO2_01_FULL_33_24]|uniref:Ribonucleoside-triphosphate reductase n=1 Tax=Candidatus Nomurabacteria bacterium RIFCSPLOWO2_01_FULL_33_24 TaxID=1801765 RepID=A0A1F6WYU2_9BACT|nr:MAG: ribonucleoside-triphosphate reductase [Candidatus Nomurabacteria bacterium RIFCSPLOWO2_01_FULL_33_24]
MNKQIIISDEELKNIPQIKKRNEQIVPFDPQRIYKAILMAMNVTKNGDEKDADYVAKRVFKDLLKLKKASRDNQFLPSVEMVQDLVEEELMLQEFTKTAKAYILYRQERAKLRKEIGLIPESVQELVKKSSKYFLSPYNEFIFYRTYSKWIPDLRRRETWMETIERFINFMKENIGDKITKKEYEEIQEAILKQEICPSQRLLWSSGPACRKSNVWAYNCSYIAPTKFQDLGEIMYILMCGAGLGFSVESENVQKFPQIKKQTGKKLKTHIISDDKEGWADAFVLAMKTWASGKDISFDYSKLRPSGSRLETAGGRASGPQPLIDLMEFAKRKVFSKQEKRLSNIDLHDIICKIGLIVVAGGVRRSALISLSDLDDLHMRSAKKGQFYISEGQRSMANNTVVYHERPTAENFLEEFTSLVKSKSGERGIFNRGGLEKQVPARRWKIIKNQRQIGLNPCGEIFLQSKQFCNLTSIVVRPKDTLQTLKEKIKLATLLGTYQSTLTNFGYLSKQWKKNCEKERLLGVSITGYYDNKIIRNDNVLRELKETAIATNKKYAKRLGINESTAITCIKPHGNSGQMLGVGSGMHPWFSPYFIRRVRINQTDPLLQFAKTQGIPIKPEIGYSGSSATTFVLEFPIKAPKGAIFKDDISAMDLLFEWKRIKENFVEHNPSVTIYVGDDEWTQVANFIYENWDIIGGLSFLPRSDHIYQLAPYEKIDEKEYNQRLSELGDLDFSKLFQYEFDDHTSGAKELACSSGVCEIDDLLAEEANERLSTVETIE